jgi:hypothetical protein
MKITAMSDAYDNYDDPDPDNLRHEFGKPKRKGFDCADGFCGAGDCRKCNGAYAEKREEDENAP